MSYSSVVKKNMASGYGKANNMYIVQKASGNAYISATSAINECDAKHSVQFNSKFNAKINTHLLDHGYGASAPQATAAYADQLNDSRLSDDGVASFKGFTHATDAGITKYYKVNFIFPLLFEKKKKKKRNPKDSTVTNSILFHHPIMFHHI